MTRVKGGPRKHAKHIKIRALAKGYRGARHRLFRKANEAVVRAGEHAFSGRKQRRRDFRRLWISRINAALSQHDIKYSRFIKGLTLAKIDLNRNMLAEMAATDEKAFALVIEKVKVYLK